MKYHYRLSPQIDLFVSNKIQEADARRQERTAEAILLKLDEQPGLILADEVGMGKTFVSLAVAVSVAVSDKLKRPVVIMVPTNLLDKWERDFRVFIANCWKGKNRLALNSAKAQDGAAFLKLLDDPEETRKQIIFLSHGAMHRALSDVFIKVAFIQRAIYGRHGTDQLKKSLSKHLGEILYMKQYEKKYPGIWNILLNYRPSEWRRLLAKKGLEMSDDPVPESVINALGSFNRKNLDTLYTALQQVIPTRASSTLADRIKIAREVLKEEMLEIWKQCLSKFNQRLPLLILDEAHHLKNSRTRFASLFDSADALEDANIYSTGGALAGTFERMIFLTATPFQLGHYELCNVLERFKGIAWDTVNAPPGGKQDFEKQITALRNRLDENQYAVHQLERYWRKLVVSDMVLDGKPFTDSEQWWKAVSSTQHSDNGTLQELLSIFRKAKKKKEEAEVLLRKWVIRHIRPRQIQVGETAIDRRKEIKGKAILASGGKYDIQAPEGIDITPDALLPFLLAARYTACTPEQRPVFAEGLASSYEAFRDTRKKDITEATDVDDDAFAHVKVLNDKDHWYLSQIEKSIGHVKQKEAIAHPKVQATVNKALELWEKGEKVLVFCHYIATGKALRAHVSRELRKRITDKAAEKLNCAPDDVWEQLDTLGKRFFREDSQLRKAVSEELGGILKSFTNLREHSENLQELVRRYIRTPSFLVRFYPLGSNANEQESIKTAFANKDNSGQSLRVILHQFFKFLEERGPEERAEYIDALNSIQSGGILSRDITEHYAPDELEQAEKEIVLPNVRLVYGATKQETRRRLMLTFNTPFYPDILIATSVMAEGVDLHLNCRYIIHHDLCWNPSTLEQRTGRVDRIGAKVEQTGQSIHVYLPYIAETQDEKMFRVVKDRERWFKVVMGEKLSINAKTAEELAACIPLPETLTEALSFKLEV